MNKILWIGIGTYLMLNGWLNAGVENEVVVYDVHNDSSSSFNYSDAIPMSKKILADQLLERLDSEQMKKTLAGMSDEPFVKKIISKGKRGTGSSEFETKLPGVSTHGDEGVIEEYGEKLTKDFPVIPYTTSRVDMYLKINKKSISKMYPYSASGRLFFKIGDSNHAYCSASMIKRGVLVTAAHCVAEYGKNEIFKDFRYTPALKNKNAPYGVWSAKKVLLLKSYLQGKEGECIIPQGAKFCLDDVALIILKPKKGKYAGDLTGYLSIGLTGYSYANGKTAQITSLGYPASHDNGEMMQRNDSAGTLFGKDLNYNTVIGTRMTEGSSGGPWIVNFGQIAKLSDGTTTGFDATPNVVIGVASGAFTDNKHRYAFASPFLKSNIDKLLKRACRIDKKACR